MFPWNKSHHSSFYILERKEAVTARILLQIEDVYHNYVMWVYNIFFTDLFTDICIYVFKNKLITIIQWNLKCFTYTFEQRTNIVFEKAVYL